ncbi:MAG: endonuclease III [Candidatus Omnitrophica bacterium]|nr:endonuclease III [Candidatus Omnitrophota bacterium]
MSDVKLLDNKQVARGKRTDLVDIAKVIRLLRFAIRDLPDPSVTLVGKKFKSPFLVLISCLLSLRTRDETTLGACERLFARADTVQGMLKIPIIEIQKLIYPVGFYKTKAVRIHDICGDLIHRFGARVPDDLEMLLTLKGVGRKTANLVLTEGFGKPGICVDTHVHRISNRLGYITTGTPEETEFALRKKLPPKYWIEFNALLVTWGQNVCKPISPLCSVCPVNGICKRVNVGVNR